MDRLDQLRAAMVLSIHGGVNRALVQWVSRHHGEPQSLDAVRLRAIVLDFDTFLMQPGIEDTEFTRAIIRLRNVFARHAKMSAPATVNLEPRPSPVMVLVPPVVAAPEPVEEAGEAPSVAPVEPRAQPLVTDDEHTPRYHFDANSVLAEALSRLLDGPRWIEAMVVPSASMELRIQA